MQLIQLVLRTFRALRCRFSNNYHTTYQHTESEMLCLHCAARWTAVPDEAGGWLRVSDLKLKNGAPAKS